MNYTEAVQLAKEGNEAGYRFLYEASYQSKYYLALKYMQNEEDAKDILQDTYVRAFSKIDTLDNPERFSAWLGVIVANTAKNALKKKNPMLFSDMAENFEEEEIAYQIKDENIQNQPEMAYFQKESKNLVHEMIDSLSEEQRMCILMFHMEGQSISEIAGTLGCSENTVKSRLNYGRKNIKIKAEELQKKGYRLYNVAPLPLLLYLLRAEEEVMAAEGTFEIAKSAMSEQIIKSVTKNSMLKMASAKVASETVKQGVMLTVAEKIIVAAVGISIITGSVIGIMVHNENKKTVPDRAVLEEMLVAVEEAEKESVTEQEATEEETTPETVVTEETVTEPVATEITTSIEKVTDVDENYGNIRVESYYEKIVLHGDLEVVEKINEDIQKDCEEFLKGSEQLIEYAESDIDYYEEPTSYANIATSEVSYRNEDVISIKVTTEWYGGGKPYYEEYGLTYDLKTGERLTLNQVCPGNASKIASRLKKLIKEEDSTLDTTDVTKSNVKDMRYYLMPGKKAIVSFGPYKLGWGGFTRTYTIDSKYE